MMKFLREMFKGTPWYLIPVLILGLILVWPMVILDYVSPPNKTPFSGPAAAFRIVMCMLVSAVVYSVLITYLLVG